MQDMEISSGSSAHDWARSTDSTRISRAEQEAERQTKEGRIRRKQKKKMHQTSSMIATSSMDLALMTQCEMIQYQAMRGTAIQFTFETRPNNCCHCRIFKYFFVQI